MNIPLIIPCFNQLTYLKNLINWFQWYYPNNPIHIVDNGSTYKPLLAYYTGLDPDSVTVSRFGENEFIKNLTEYLKFPYIEQYEYYCLSDPDIMPAPNTPMNFLEEFKFAIDQKGYHRAGFNLITDDLPDYLNEKAMIVGNEKELLREPVLKHGEFLGYKAPLDTTFCLYKRDNGGWSCPMDGKNWGNCLRLFNAYHLGWFVDGNNLNEEMKYYFEHAKYRVPGQPSAGSCNNMPEQFKPKEI